MKAICKALGGRLAFEVNAETPKELFGQVGDIMEIFDAESACGCCQSKNIRPSHRKVKDFDYYDLMCQDCGAQFSFGQRKLGGGLFPKRRDKDGHDLANGGWQQIPDG